MSSIQFQILSDLHLETPKTRPTYTKLDIEAACPYLALLGDIGNVLDAGLFAFLEQQLQKFEIVFFLLGNHEPYGITFAAAQANVSTFERDIERRHNLPGSTLGRFIFLNRTRYDLTQNVTILGCTLFSRIMAKQRDSVSRFVSDFSNIEDWTVDDHCAAHELDLEWLNSQTLHIMQHEPHRTIVIFTHHNPSILEQANDPRHAVDASQVQSAFVTDLSNQICWTSAQVRLWGFGHTHFNCDFEDPMTGKRVVANQKGYHRSEVITFDVTKAVKAGTYIRKGSMSPEEVLGLSKKRKDRSKNCVLS